MKLIRALRHGIDGQIYKMQPVPRTISGLMHQQSDTVLVVGNGPSLNHTPLDSVHSNIISIGMNKIDLLFPRTSWRPDIIVCENSIVLQQHSEEYASSSIPVMVPFQQRYFLKQIGENIYYYNRKHSRNFSISPKNFIGSGYTVTYACLQIAQLYQPRKIILVGIDHNFKFHGDANERNIMNDDDVNHFDPNYFGNGSAWNNPDLLESENDYQAASRMLSGLGIDVVDCTVNGKLNIFRKSQLNVEL